MAIVERFFWALTIVGSVLGFVLLYETLTTATGAPQQAAGAALAIASSVIPYCLARAIQLGRRD